MSPLTFLGLILCISYSIEGVAAQGTFLDVLPLLLVCLTALVALAIGMYICNNRKTAGAFVTKDDGSVDYDWSRY